MTPYEKCQWFWLQKQNLVLVIAPHWEKIRGSVSIGEEAGSHSFFHKSSYILVPVRESSSFTGCFYTESGLQEEVIFESDIGIIVENNQYMDASSIKAQLHNASSVDFISYSWSAANLESSQGSFNPPLGSSLVDFDPCLEGGGGDWRQILLCPRVANTIGPCEVLWRGPAKKRVWVTFTQLGTLGEIDLELRWPQPCGGEQPSIWGVKRTHPSAEFELEPIWWNGDYGYPRTPWRLSDREEIQLIAERDVSMYTQLKRSHTEEPEDWETPSIRYRSRRLSEALHSVPEQLPYNSRNVGDRTILKLNLDPGEVEEKTKKHLVKRPGMVTALTSAGFKNYLYQEGAIESLYDLPSPVVSNFLESTALYVRSPLSKYEAFRDGMGDPKKLNELLQNYLRSPVEYYLRSRCSQLGPAVERHGLPSGQRITAAAIIAHAAGGCQEIEEELEKSTIAELEIWIEAANRGLNLRRLFRLRVERGIDVSSDTLLPVLESLELIDDHCLDRFEERFCEGSSLRLEADRTRAAMQRALALGGSVEDIFEATRRLHQFLSLVSEHLRFLEENRSMESDIWIELCSFASSIQSDSGVWDVWRKLENRTQEIAAPYPVLPSVDADVQLVIDMYLIRIREGQMATTDMLIDQVLFLLEELLSNIRMVNAKGFSKESSTIKYRADRVFDALERMPEKNTVHYIGLSVENDREAAEYAVDNISKHLVEVLKNPIVRRPEQESVLKMFEAVLDRLKVARESIIERWVDKNQRQMFARQLEGYQNKQKGFSKLARQQFEADLLRFKNALSNSSSNLDVLSEMNETLHRKTESAAALHHHWVKLASNAPRPIVQELGIDLDAEIDVDDLALHIRGSGSKMIDYRKRELDSLKEALRRFLEIAQERGMFSEPFPQIENVVQHDEPMSETHHLVHSQELAWLREICILDELISTAKCRRAQLIELMLKKASKELPTELWKANSRFFQGEIEKLSSTKQWNEIRQALDFLPSLIDMKMRRTMVFSEDLDKPSASDLLWLADRDNKCVPALIEFEYTTRDLASLLAKLQETRAVTIRYDVNGAMGSFTSEWEYLLGELRERFVERMYKLSLDSQAANLKPKPRTENCRDAWIWLCEALIVLGFSCFEDQQPSLGKDPRYSDEDKQLLCKLLGQYGLLPEGSHER